jgi:hypothetical protein
MQIIHKQFTTSTKTLLNGKKTNFWHFVLKRLCLKKKSAK